MINQLTPKTIALILPLTGAMTCSTHSFADTDADNKPGNGLNVSVQLRHRIIIPQIIYLRIGSAVPGGVDKVTIDLNNSPDFNAGNSQSYTSTSAPLGDASPVNATNNGTLVVDVRSNVGTVTISYEVSNTLGLSDGAGNFIAFDQIETISSDTNLPSPILSNTGGASGSGITVDINGNLYSGRVINRQATWAYRYKNQVVPLAGTYSGRITYTASAP